MSGVERTRGSEFQEPYPVKKQKTKEDPSTLEAEKADILTLLPQTLAISQQKRNEKLATLTSEEIKSLETLEGNIDNIKNSTQEKFLYHRDIEADATRLDELEEEIKGIENKIAGIKSDSSDQSEKKRLEEKKVQLEDEFKELDGKEQPSFDDHEFTECKQKIVSKELGISDSLVGELSSWGSGKSDLMETVYKEIRGGNDKNFDLIFFYQKEKLLNRALNTILYKKEVRTEIFKQKYLE